MKQLTIEITPSKYSFKTIPINDLFDFTSGRVISKKYVERNKGEYPVYSSNTLNNGVFGYINSFDFDCEGLTWTTDGIYAGTLFYRKGKFSITNICGLMRLKKDIPENSIWLPYIQKVIDFRDIATGHDNKKVMTNVIVSSNIEVKLPITSSGEFDLLAQQEITKEYQAIEQVKQELEEKLNVLLKPDISLQ
ncbi:MAG: restriction endonuclease subunit S [Ignavibacteriae bacterium]|nr:restriction endonuclease subunit S [Ignavibacteriota bacterium]